MVARAAVQFQGVTMEPFITFEGLDRMNKAVMKQLPQAVTWALNWTSFAARGLAVNALPKTFTIRSTWVERGFRVLRAMKRDFGTARHASTVGNLRPFMDFHVRGGRATKTGGETGTIVPVAARPTKTAAVKRKQFPRAVFKKRITADETAAQINAGRRAAAKWFAVDIPGTTDVGIYRRDAGAGEFAELWWRIVDDVRIPKRWPFNDQVERIARERLQRNFNRAMDKALKTAR